MGLFWRKRIGKGALKLNLSLSPKGLGHSFTLGTTNKKGPGISTNTKSGTTVSLRGTGIRATRKKGKSFWSFFR